MAFGLDGIPLSRVEHEEAEDLFDVSLSGEVLGSSLIALMVFILD
jgi:hypothetical protein